MMYVLLTRSVRGAECWTDHRLVRTIVRLQIRPLARKQKTKKKLNIKSCADPRSTLSGDSGKAATHS